MAQQILLLYVISGFCHSQIVVLSFLSVSAASFFGCWPMFQDWQAIPKRWWTTKKHCCIHTQKSHHNRCCYCYYDLFPGGVCTGEGCAISPFLSHSPLLTRPHTSHHLCEEEWNRQVGISAHVEPCIFLKESFSDCLEHDSYHDSFVFSQAPFPSSFSSSSYSMPTSFFLSFFFCSPFSSPYYSFSFSHTAIKSGMYYKQDQSSPHH